MCNECIINDYWKLNEFSLLKLFSSQFFKIQSLNQASFSFIYASHNNKSPAFQTFEIKKWYILHGWFIFHWFSFSLFSIFYSFQVFANNFLCVFRKNNIPSPFMLFTVAGWRGRSEIQYWKKSTEILSSRLNWKHEVEHANVCGKSNFWYEINEKRFASWFQRRYSKLQPTTRLSTSQVDLSERKLKSFA